MTEVRTLRVKSSLSRKMAKPGGRTTGEAVALADAALESHRHEGMQTLADHLTELERVSLARQPHDGPRVYELASAFLDLAGFFETGPLYSAAYSLCDLSDRFITQSRWDWPSVDVHLRAMRLMLASGCVENTSSILILEGLATVSRHRA